MVETAPEGKVNQGTKLMVALAAIGLVVMFASSVFHRLESPSRKEFLGQPRQSASQGMPGQQDMSEMGKLMAALREKPDDPQANLDIAKAFMRMQEAERAEVFLQRALEADPNNIEALRLLAMAAFQAQQHEQAAQTLMRLLAKRPDDAGAHFNLAVLYSHYLNDAQKADFHMRKAREHAEGDPQLLEMIEREAKAHGN
ncbi:tetratricopeptide repeat protein [Desulfocurvibacter africanus]|uniref:Tetratricopeptide TPR_1 repeat-containing protein n=1 Tax=Desulfocurvibacter africanus subsp. africanus str. Walvis Bay TaxID=690850 RepID=F3Z3S1_DESAF|nr:tetratricopeptide repeat protein [Desulfocurvibacter africanus]EGJ51536.1 Tetratricopeptide TPR_1 repeat-containing protein [Desulfocurvibacter africanus subsp. africanus str. Walvis Bay]